MKRSFLFYSLLILCLLTTCAEEEQNPLPYMYVNCYITPMEIMAGLPEKVKLGTEGYNRNGLIIVSLGIGNEEYAVYDATCTRDITKDAKSINVIKGEFTATCPQCHTVYNLFNGGYAQNQSFRLQRYRAYRGSDGRIFVTN